MCHNFDEKFLAMWNWRNKFNLQIQWLFNNRPVHGKDFLVSVSGERQVLSIPQAAESHRGIVSCVAENAAGKAICSAQLDVGKWIEKKIMYF